MADAGAEISGQFTYKAVDLALGENTVWGPTINSNSYVGSILHHVGIEIEGNEPTANYTNPGLYNLLGTTGADNLATGGETTVLFGGAGADTLTNSQAQNSTLVAGRDYDKDTLVGNADKDLLVGYFNATDLLQSDSMSGGAGRDRFLLIDPATALAGGIPADPHAGSRLDLWNALDGVEQQEPASSYIDGGDGVDAIDLSGLATPTAGVTFDLDARSATGDRLITNVENVYGTKRADNLSGDSWANSIAGGGDADFLTGRQGSDFLLGEAGSDTLYANEADADGLTYDGSDPNLIIYEWSWGDDFYSEHSWAPADWSSDKLWGGEGYDTYHVGMMGGYFERFEDGAPVEDYQDTGSLVWTYDGVGLTFQPFVYSRMDIVHDEDGQGSIHWGIDGTQSPQHRNITGLIDSSEPDQLVLETDYSSLFGHDTYSLSNWSGFLLQFHSYEDPETGVTADRLVFMMEPNIDGIIEPSSPVYGLFGVDGFFDGAFGLSLAGYRPQYVGNGNGNIIVGTISHDDISGNGGADTIDGKAGDDTADGGTGNDTVSGGEGNDTLLGGDDNDILNGGLGDDTLDGGAGVDTASYSDASWDAVIHLALGWANGGQAGWDTLVSIEDAIAGSGNDELIGDTGANRLEGNGGNDIIYAGAGNDWLIGGAGNDTLVGEAGDDTLNGGSGNDLLVDGLGADTYVFAPAFGADRVEDWSENGETDRLSFGEGISASDIIVRRGLTDNWDAVLSVAAGDNVLVQGQFHGGDWGVEEIRFFDGTIWNQNDLRAQYLTQAQTAGDDSILGFYDADDEISAGAGNDMIFALDGDDMLDGGDGDDGLYADAGDDTLTGGAGDDFLLGGLGADTFVFGAGFGSDWVGDFTAGTDVLAFDVAVFLSYQDVLNAASEADGNTRIAAGDDLLVLADIELASLSASDFIFV